MIKSIAKYCKENNEEKAHECASNIAKRLRFDFYHVDNGAKNKPNGRQFEYTFLSEFNSLNIKLLQITTNGFEVLSLTYEER